MVNEVDTSIIDVNKVNMTKLKDIKDEEPLVMDYSNIELIKVPG